MIEDIVVGSNIWNAIMGKSPDDGSIEYDNDHQEYPLVLDGKLFDKEFYNIVKYIKDQHVYKFDFISSKMNEPSPYRRTMFYQYHDLYIEIYESKYYETDSFVRLYMCNNNDKVLCYSFYSPLLSRKKCRARWHTCGKIQDIVVKLFKDFVTNANELIEIKKAKREYDKKCSEVAQQIKTYNDIHEIVKRHEFISDGIIDWM